MRIARFLLAAGLLVAFASAAPGASAATPRGAGAPARDEAAATSAINPLTWAPAGTGAYFFDRSAGGTAAFARREAQFGRKFDGHMYYVPADVTARDLADPHWSLTVDHVPFVVLSWGSGSNPTTIIPEIAAGRYDAAITGFARAVKSQLSPYGHVLIRPFWEFNFTGSEWSDIHYGGNPAKFIAAWRRFVGIFRQQAVPNVKWVWNPNRMGGSQTQNPLPYYPGSAYVDWIGLDAYPKHNWLTLQQLATTSVGSNFDWYDTFRGYGKPLMIGEVGILPANAYGSGAPTRATWWRDAAYELRHSLTAVKAFEYFDVGTAHDWRYDAPGTAPGDSGAAALAAAASAARQCVLDVLARGCGSAPHARKKRKTHRHSPSPSPSPAGAASPSASPSRAHLSAPNPGPSALSLGIFAGVFSALVIAVALAYRRFHRL
jgi:hypothetical protein